MSEKGIHIQKYDDGNEAVVVKFGSGKIGIGLDKNSLFHLTVHLQELNKEKEVGEYLTQEELNAYQGQRKMICGWGVEKTIKFDRRLTLLDFGINTPPQSWCYTNAR